jgi:hypothetical protein
MKSVGCLTTVLGKVGSTEEMFLAGFPSDFRYVPGLNRPGPCSWPAHTVPQRALTLVSAGRIRTWRLA